MACNKEGCDCGNTAYELQLNGDTAYDTYLLEGGMGKMVMFTALVDALAEKSEEGYINIVSQYNDVFFGNPKIKNSWTIDEFYEHNESIKHLVKDVFNYEPYKGNFKMHNNMHLLSDYARAYGISWDQSMQPKVFVADEIKAQADKAIEGIGDFIIIQFSGGQPAIDFDVNAQYQNNLMQQQRNYPQAMGQHFVNIFKANNPDVTIIDYSLPNEPSYDGTIRFPLPYTGYAYLLSKALTFVGIDSSLAHLAASVDKKGVVLWGGIPAYKFSWSSNVNITNYDGKSSFDEFNSFYIAVDYNILNNEVEKIIKE